MSDSLEERRIRELLERMTLPEKLAQLGAVWGSALLESGSFSKKRAAAALEHGIGQITRLGGASTLEPEESARAANEIQRFLRDETRLGIPAIVHEESCAGYAARGATCFPQAIGLASTWEPEVLEAMTNVIRAQMRSVGAHLALAPVLDLTRDPRWGRSEETFGEDPYLTSRLGCAYVRGLQGDDLRGGVAATAKHFLGYGASQGGLNWAPASITARELRESFLPPFEAAIREAGIAAVMNAYHEIDGLPCGASRELLEDLLRGELGFEGLVVSDYFTLQTFVSYHGIAATDEDAARRGLLAGLDVELPASACFAEPLRRAIDAGEVPEEIVDRSVARVLQLKLRLGLFEAREVEPAAARACFDTPEQRELARTIARKSIVLLKNEGDLLPLDASVGSVAVIGPSADEVRLLQGDYHYPTHLEIMYGPTEEGWAAPGPESGQPSALDTSRRAGEVDLRTLFVPMVTVLEGVRAAVGARTEVRTAHGCDILDPSTAGISEAVALARRSEVAIVVVGGRSGLVPGCTSGEFCDRAELGLPGVQSELVRAVLASGTPTVVVLINGRPLALTDFADVAPAIIEAWIPGEEGGHAVADVLFGRTNPAGRLPVTLPRAVGQIPLYYNHKPSAQRSPIHGDYADLSTRPLFPFGHGLSYTSFEYANLVLSSTRLGASDPLQIALELRNTGSRAGEEVVQLYVRDPVASVTRPVKQLKGFRRVALGAGERCRLSFQLDLAQLAFYDEHMRLVVEPGCIELMLGSSSEDIRLRGEIEITGDVRQVRTAEIEPTRVEVS